MGKISEKLKENWDIILFGAFILLVTATPYLYGYYTTPEGKYFTGVVTISYYDTYTYLAWIEQAKQGFILFTTLYSTESVVNVMFHPLFLIMGFFADLFSLSNILIYHLFRIFLGGVFLFVSYFFINEVIHDKLTQRTAFYILSSSSGIGYMLSEFSADRWMTEYITFLNLYQSPLNLVSMTIMLLIFIIVLRLKVFSVYAVFLLALLINLLTFIHMYDVLIILAILFFYTLYCSYFEKNQMVLRLLLYVGILSVPGILWQQWVLLQNTTLGIWAYFQTNVPSPHFLHYISGYGLLLFFVIIGTIYSFKNKLSNSLIMILIWLAVIPLLLFAPFLSRFQRKFSEGYHIPISIIASVGIVWWLNNLSLIKIKSKTFALIVIIVTLSFTNVHVIISDIKAFGSKNFPYYVLSTEIDSIYWLKDNTPKSARIATGYNMGNIIPGVAGRQVFLGNVDQTVNFNYKYQLIYNSYILDKDYNTLVSLLKDYQLNYFVVDDEVRSWGELDVANRPYLKLVYENPDVQIYEIDQTKLD